MKRFTLNLSDELHERLVKMAADDRRSLQQEILLILETSAEAHEIAKQAIADAHQRYSKEQTE